MIRIQSILLVLSMTLSFSANAQKLKGKERRSVKRLKANIAYLASDHLMGRATGTEGERKSAEFIASEFERLKLEPMGDNGFFQTFTITTLRIADGSSKVNVNGEQLKLFTDYYPLGYSANACDVNTGMVNVAFGIVNDSRNDYDSIDALGKVVLINVGSPDGVHPHSKYLGWHGINIRVDEAVKNGAVGVVFYRSDESVKQPSGELSLTMKPSTVPVLFLTRLYQNVEDIAFASINLKVITDEDTGYNVIGYNDNGADNTIIIGAHHDHLGQGQHGNSLAENSNEIHNGADDNASGTAALFELAKALKKSKKWNKNNNYLFIAFSGEELGLIGSKYYVNNPVFDPGEGENYMINMDMIGMLNEDKVLIINGVGTSPVFYKTIAALDETKRGIHSIKQGMSGVGPSDHTSFYLKGIPSLHFFTGAHKDYHKPTDDIENLNYEGEVFVINYILSMIKELNGSGKLEFTKTKDDSNQSLAKARSKFAVTLGVVPNYVFEGEGMQIDAVREGKPGHKAGLMAKDIVVSFAGMNIADMRDYMAALETLKPGDKTQVGVIRDGELIKFDVQF